MISLYFIPVNQGSITLSCSQLPLQPERPFISFYKTALLPRTFSVYASRSSTRVGFCAIRLMDKSNCCVFGFVP
jgi:hypothetical protein